MNGHRSAIKKGGQSLLHRHFHQPDHPVDYMRVQILEKIYHSSENPTLLTSIRRTRELFWIKGVGSAKPYGFNGQIKGVSTLSSISCKKTNIYSLFNPISTGLFCLVVALGGGGVFSTPLRNSFVFKVRLLKFCTEVL